MLKTVDIPMSWCTTLVPGHNINPTHQNDPQVWPTEKDLGAQGFWPYQIGLMKPNYNFYPINNDQLLSATLFLHNESTSGTGTGWVRRCLKPANHLAAYTVYDGTNTWENGGATGATDRSAPIHSGSAVSILPNRWMQIPLVLSQYILAKNGAQSLILHTEASMEVSWPITNINQPAPLNTSGPFIRITFNAPGIPMPIFFQ